MSSIPPINKGMPVVEPNGPNDKSVFSRASNFLSGQFLRWLNELSGFFQAGVYTPQSINAPININLLTFNEFRYVRVGNVVNVSGSLTYSALSSGIYLIWIDVPIGATITNTDQLTGVGADRNGSITTSPITVYGSTSPVGAIIEGYAVNTSFNTRNINFSYTIN